MAYFMINGKDYSAFVNELKVSTEANFNAQTNAAGNSVVDYINSKKVLEVGFIPMSDNSLIKLMNDATFHTSITYRNPLTNELDTISCILSSSEIEYYTIQLGKVQYKAFTLTFTEL